MSIIRFPLAILAAVALFAVILGPDTGLGAGTGAVASQGPPADPYAGSVSCRKCHEKFYQLWAPSHHGQAMQPYTSELGRNKLSAQTQDIVIGGHRYRADLSGHRGWVVEQGPQGETKYPIDHAMGGKNVYYFLTPLDRGRLQTLPLAYDVNKKEWFDMAASGVRHFPGQTDEAIHWKDWQYTFNTACYGCHVSQVSTNYDPKNDSYHTVWKEPGINCETCHGPAEEHIRVCEAAEKGTIPKDLKIKRGGRDFSRDQNNATCGTCHAKAVALTDHFQPGDRFFDHFGLVTLENPDYYPDGRDLGENYTYTSWLMSPCAKSGGLDCLHCHTSSGRYKFNAVDKANHACMPCHKEKVENSTEHTHHKSDSPGNKCIACHMSMTEFARMRRSDHSMLPPSPSATIAFGSPNACNFCHADKKPKWADDTVRTWRKRDYQAAVLHRAGLVDAARKREWTKLPEMLDYIASKDRDEVFAASLLRLLAASGDPRVGSGLLKAIKDPSPLVRSAAVTGLQNVATPEAARALADAGGDDFLLVRVGAAASLAGHQYMPQEETQKSKIEAANKEYLRSILSRPDQWDSHYNLGNYYLDRRDFKQAVSSYEKALQMEPRAVLAMVNQALAHARMGENQKASDALNRALQAAPDNAAANFNMGLLKAEQNDLPAAEKHLRAALKTDPHMAQAAYNLCIILSKDRLDEALEFCGQAAQLRLDQPKYAYTLAFFQQSKGDFTGAVKVLKELLGMHPAYGDAYILLGGIHQRQGNKAQAEVTYKQGLSVESLPHQYRARLKLLLEALNRQPGMGKGSE